MSEHQVINSLSVGVDYEALAERFRPIFKRIAAGAVALDRHWRNARTVSSHNPVSYKARIVGD